MGNNRFTPARGLEKDILSREPLKGVVWFATDTKKIYYSDGKQFLSMGGNSSIFYGSKEFEQDEEDAIVIFKLKETIEGTQKPMVDDLILNIPSGCFYRVTSADAEDNIEAVKITVAGSGTGEGGSTGEDVASLILNPIEGVSTGQTFVLGQDAYIYFSATVDNGDTVIKYNVEIKNEYADEVTTVVYSGKDLVADNGAKCKFNLGAVLKLGRNTIKVSASSDNANVVKTKTISMVQCVEMYLNSSPNFNPLNFFSGEITFECIPVGENLTKNIDIYFDNSLISSISKRGIILNDIQTFKIPAVYATHGMHTITAVLTCDESAAQASLTYNIGCIEEGNGSSIIWYNANTPNQIVNHDPLTIEYMVYNPVKSNEIETHYYINGSEIPTSPSILEYNQTKWFKWRILNYELGNNVMTISSGTTAVQIPIEVLPDTKRNLDISTAGLLVNLTAAGRSNEENIQSRSTWECISTDKATTTKVKFNDFNWYNNGWIMDDEGETCLRVSNGASIEIPLNVMNQTKLSNSLAFELVFKIRNVQNYSTLINTVVENPEDIQPTIKKVISSTDGVWGNYYNKSIGFCLGTQEAFFKSQNTLVSGRYKEDELVHLTFVIEAPTENTGENKLIYMYINGVNSAVTSYPYATDNLNSGCKKLVINSDYCDVDIYNIRVYKANLTQSLVIQNYLADLNDAELYDMNNDIVTYVDGVPTIDYVKMLEYNATHADTPLMPYMLIETVDTNDELPYKKQSGKGWSVNIDFVNPTLDYEYENNVWTVKDLEDRGYSSRDEMYLHSCPSYRATKVDLNVQGTSSQGYPIRNYKAKFKNAEKWEYTGGPLTGISIKKGGKVESSGLEIPKKWFMDSWVGENKTTLKADYMDSSGCHNTGFANLVHSLYSKHPLDDYNIEDCDSTKLRTSVYGFPILIFQKTHDVNKPYKFLGKYNYNIDKGCDDTFGFCDWGDDSYVDVTSLVNIDNFNYKKLYVLEEGVYTKLSEDAVYDSSKHYYRLDKGSNSYALNPDYNELDPYSRKYLPWSEAAECWEFSHNQGGRCSFKYADFNETFLDKYGNTVLSVLNDFEYRYHADGDNLDLAMDNNISSFGSQEQLNDYVVKKMSRWEKAVAWVASTDPDTATNEPLSEPYIVNSVTYDIDSPEYRLAKFRNEFEKHFDKEYCMVYFIMTELLICYDSRGKNLMMATWGPHEKGGEDIWYPIFYDIDTQLGVNNSGVPYWDYYEEPTDNNTFSTPNSVLWNNLKRCFLDDIKNHYRKLSNKLTYDIINGYYSFDPNVTLSIAMKGSRPIILNNVDEYQKYIAPSTTGYIDTGNNLTTTSYYFYCLQGTRELQRKLFLRNRINYLNSKWQSGSYDKSAIVQEISTRFDANNISKTSDKYLGREVSQEEANLGFVYAEPGTQPLDFDPTYKITPYLKQYISYSWDEVLSSPIYANGGETISVPPFSHKLNDIYNTPNMTQQLLYWGGDEYISSLGDLSLKYLDKFTADGAKRLKDLILGSDTPGYRNELLNSDSFTIEDQKTIIKDGQVVSNPNAKTLLEKVVLTNLTGLTKEQTYTGSEKLKELRALNTGIPAFTLADGVQIEILHLPEATNSLILREPTSLKNILTSYEPENKIVDKYIIVNITEESYDPSVHYINTLDGYKLCNDESYFASNPDYRDADGNYLFVSGVGLPFNVTRTYYIKESIEETVYPSGLYIEGLTNVENITDTTKTKLNTLDIIGGNMGYDSYVLLDKLVQIKEKMIANSNLGIEYDKHLSINLANVDWTPFRLVEAGEVPESGVSYYKLSDHGTLDLYEKVSNEYPKWNLNVTNGIVYAYREDIFNKYQNTITDLSIFDKFINDYQTAKDVYDGLEDKNNYDQDNYNFFKNTDGYVIGPTLADITGIVYINNSADNPIDESILKNYYHDTYYPKLTFHAAHVTKSNIAKFVEIIDEATGQEKVWDTLKYPSIGEDAKEYPELSAVIPSRLNYDFRGWSTTAYAQEDLDGMSATEINNILVTEDSIRDLLFAEAEDQIIKFYAVYTIHTYTIKYVDYNGATLQTMKVPSGEYIPLPTKFPYRDDSDLSLEETYGLVGYSKIQNASKADLIPYKEGEPYLDLKSGVGGTDLILYPYFERMSVYDNVLSKSFLLKRMDGDKLYIGVNPIYQGELKGKITIPIVFDGTPVDGINMSGFANQYYITHVFWEKETSSKVNNITTILDNGFRNCSNLKYVEPPKNLSTIKEYAFNNCGFLFRNNTTEDIRAFFSNVTSIGGSAFENLGRGYSKSDSYDSGITLILPGKLKSIGTGGFKNTGFVNFQLGAPGDGCQLDYTTCGQSLFAAGSSNPLTIINFTIYTDNPSDAKWSLSDAQVASRLFASTNIPANYAVIDSNA